MRCGLFMMPRTPLLVTNGRHTAEMSWGAVCFVWIGSANTDIIRRVRGDLEQHGYAAIWSHDGIGLIVETIDE